MPRRIVVTLPDKTVALLDRNLIGVTRSWVIDRAIRTFFGIRTARTLKERIEEGCIANAERDRKLAAEWFPLEEEAWEIGEDWDERGRPPIPGGGRSTGSTSTRRSARRSARRGRR